MNYKYYNRLQTHVLLFKYTVAFGARKPGILDCKTNNSLIPQREPDNSELLLLWTYSEDKYIYY